MGELIIGDIAFKETSSSSYIATSPLFEDQFEGTSLDSNWQTQGAVTTSVGGGFLNMQDAGAANFTTYIRRSDKTYCTNYFNAEFEYYLRQTDAGDFGMSLAFKHSTGRAYDFRYSHNDGFLKLFFNNGATGNISSSQSVIPSVDDKIKLSVTIRENRATAKLYINDVLQFTLRVNWDIDLNKTYKQPNRVTPTIGIFGCPEVDVTYYKFIDLYKSKPSFSFVGDSYTQGFDAINAEDVWTNIVCDYYNMSCSKYAGGGNLTQNILDGIEQITENDPSNVILMIGVNDVNAAEDLETVIKPNIISIVDQLESSGINVWVCTAELFKTSSPLDDWIRTNYHTQLIDMKGFLAGGGTSNTGSEGLTSVTTHPNVFANKMMAEGVIQFIAENNLLA